MVRTIIRAERFRTSQLVTSDGHSILELGHSLVLLPGVAHHGTAWGRAVLQKVLNLLLESCPLAAVCWLLGGVLGRPVLVLLAVHGMSILRGILGFDVVILLFISAT